MDRIWTRMRINWRSALAFVHDVVAVAVAWTAAFLFRFNFDIEEPFTEGLLSNFVWLVPVQAAIFIWLGMYRGLWRYASLPDLRRILTAAALGGLVIALIVLLAQRPYIPRSVILLYPILLAMLMGGSRIAYRAWKEGHLTRIGSDGRRVIVIGGGAAAVSLLKNMGRRPEWNFVGLLVDDPALQKREIQGVPVLGTLDQLPAMVEQHSIQLAVIAMPEQPHRVRRRAVELCSSAKLPAMTVPSYDDLVSGKITVSQLRRVELDDLLGRDPVQLDTAGLRDWVSGRTVLVTGAGGSIGAELCRQLLNFAPATLVLVESSEYALYTIEDELRGAGHENAQIAAVIADVKDARRVDAVMTRFRPSVVFHAAAYKHVPLMEEANAWEAVRNNALGTWRTAQAAIAHRVEKFVFVSTDKAVNPTSVMGASKRLAEMLCQAQSGSTRFVTVRFGNVLGSTGSVIPKFRKQIAAGGPVTVTHPEMRRYFMTIPEAAQLILQAGLMGRGGEIFVLDMGDPVKIVDLARDMIRLTGFTEDDIKIVFTGTRPGEKLYEELLADNERTLPTPHPKLRVMKPEMPQPREWVIETLEWLDQPRLPDDAEVRAKLRASVPEYQPAGEIAAPSARYASSAS